ncbi:unnamed protein product [Orchesella dallaii]|uniref:Arrestin C-terminal-like domain-containing protein n=1 Tax=Orchesella dallaii TaxID=48710 RepID=A0ABP1PKC9_9HEXA
MGIQIRLNFENPHSLFRPGEIIRGIVYIKSDGKINQLTLTFHGEGNVLCRQVLVGPMARQAYYGQQSQSGHLSHNRIHPIYPNPYHISGPQTSTNHLGKQVEVNKDPNTGEVRRIVLEFRNQETYLHVTENIPVSVSYEEHKSTTEYNFPITFQLPTNLPTSCELPLGFVKYFAEVNVTYRNSTLEISHDSTEIVREPFHIKGNLDFSLVNGALEPIVVENWEQFYTFMCFCRNRGDFVMKLRLAKSGFIPGEEIRFELSYINDTNITIKKLTARLIQKITYVCLGMENTEVKEMCVMPHFLKIFSGDKGKCMGGLKISENALITDLGGCRIIRVRYAVQVRAFGSCGRKAVVEAPITIGNIAKEMKSAKARKNVQETINEIQTEVIVTT